MRHNKDFFTFALLVAASFCTKANAQSAFAYTRGKTFNNVASARMDKAIELGKLASAVLREKQIPQGHNTISYAVKLPKYKKGMFFSRDSRPSDHQWPNNTNRLLNWTFARLADLTKKDYKGIPSNSAPSLLGDALLLELADGSYLYAKAVAGYNSMSWFQVNEDGTLTMYLSTLGTDNLAKSAPVVLAQRGNTAYEAIGKAYSSLIGDKEIANLQKRADKDHYEAFDYLGWCSWEHHHFDIDEKKILSDIDGIEASGLPIRYVLIDDGHLASKNQQLTSFAPNAKKFPEGWKNIMARKKEDKIKWLGLWYCFSGYWLGISPENDFPQNVKQALYPYNGSLLPGKSDENIQTYYNYYISTLKDYGFDFLKIDNQSFQLPLYMGNEDVVRQAKACNTALEEATHGYGVGLMNCMAQNIINIDNTRYSGLARVSIDYTKYNEDMAKSHLFQCYTNTLTQGQTVWPDHDMFHSSDSICGGLMAHSKAMSGGPVYLSDSPADFVKQNILPLVAEDGRIFRPKAPAIPTAESVITNPLTDGNAYRVFAPTGDEAVSLICYNLNTSSTHKHVMATISPKDYSLRETMGSGNATIMPKRMLLFDWKKQSAEVITKEKAVGIDGFDDRLFHLCPIVNGWAVIGIQDKFLSPTTVEILGRSDKNLTLNVLCPGTLRVWVEKNGHNELRSITVKKAGRISIKK